MLATHIINDVTVCYAEKKEWKVAPDLIKTKSNKPKRLKESKEGRGWAGRTRRTGRTWARLQGIDELNRFAEVC